MNQNSTAAMDKQLKDAYEAAKPLLDHLNSSAIQPLSGSLDKVFQAEPHLKMLIELLKLPQSISDFLFVHKFNKCFYTSKLDQAGFDKLNKRLTGNKRARFWKLIFTSIQSHDDEKRSELVGKVISALAFGRIMYDVAIRMIHASNTVNVENLDYLRDCYLGGAGMMPGYARQEFATLGLLGIDNSSIGTLDGGGPIYPLTDFGAQYVGAIYDYPAYPSRQDLKVGIDHLVRTSKSLGNSNRLVLPLQEVIDQGHWYGEAALILRDEESIWISRGSPVVAANPIYAGDYGEKTLADSTGINEEAFTFIASKNDESRHVTTHYYALEKDLVGQITIPVDPTASWTDYRTFVDKKDSEELQWLAHEILTSGSSL